MSPEERERLVEVMARAAINKRRERIKSPTSMDSYDVLRSWAFADPKDQEPGTVGYRAHRDNFTAARKEWDDLHAEADAAISAAERAGFHWIGPEDGR